MQIIRTDTFKQQYKKLPQPIKEQAKKQLGLFLPKLSDFFKDVIFLLELAYFQAKMACSNLSLKT